MINIFIDVICGALNALGGWRFLWMRRFLMPVVLCMSVCLTLRSWWLGFLVLPAIGTLCLGYFNGKNWGRALWLFVQAIALSTGLLIFHHLMWWIFIPYIIGAGILGGMYKNWPQVIGDAITGVYLSLFIWGIHG